MHEINTGFIAAPTSLLKGWLEATDAPQRAGRVHLTDIVAMAVAEGVGVGAHVVTDQCRSSGSTIARSWRVWSRTVQRRRATALMLAGASILDPARIDIRGELACRRDVTIDVGCVFEGTVKLADGASIGPYCVLRDVTVGAGTRVEAFSHFDSAVIGRNCRIRAMPGCAPAQTLLKMFISAASSR